MKHDFWLEKWKFKEIGFHQETYNENFQKYFHLLELTKGDCLFFPLCGKSKDMLWASQQGIKVIGSELSEIACSEFFEENDIDYKKEDSIYYSDLITLYSGDIFNLNTKKLKEVRAIYDRAALIALPKETRKKYALFCQQVFGEIKILLDVLELYKEDGALREDGPPHSVTEDEIKSLYAPKHNTQLINQQEITVSNQFIQKGIRKIVSNIYLLSNVLYY